MNLEEKHNKLSDLELIELIKLEDDIQHKSILFNRYIDKVYGVCLKYLQHEDQAKDAMMSIYELFIRKIGNHSIENLNAWIYVMSKNYCFDLLRKKKRTIEKMEAYKSVQFEPIYHPYNEDEQETKLDALNKCVETLKKDQKMVINLFYTQKLSYEKISEEMTLSWSQIRSLIQNARRNLKKCMQA